MITQRAENYAKILFSMNLKDECIESTKRIFSNCAELFEVLQNPVVKNQEKVSVIDALFDKEITGFLKVLCDNNEIGTFGEIMEAYELLIYEQKNIIKAKLAYAIKPNEEQVEQIKCMLCSKYKKSGAVIELMQDMSLISGYVLYVGDTEYDKSMKGTLSEMQKTLVKR